MAAQRCTQIQRYCWKHNGNRKQGCNKYNCCTFSIRIEITIINQEILELLAEQEEILFYALCDDRDNEALRTTHESARQSLESFAHATGCYN